ncbi:MAG TPA: molybdopterin-dependent oxidoreductase [Methylovirgula sp.]|nr:molybdopterin-dependent oxidoreductase [Methylovirgula sp.]
MIRTTCPYCGVGCGVLAEKVDGKVNLSGDPDHPANFGRLCSKGSALGETIGLETRLLHPKIEGRRATWDEALDLVASTFSRTLAEHGPESIAFYVSGQFLTEDYYVANKLMKGYIGSANIDTNSRLCMASSVAGHRRAFGADVVPGCYEDLECADLIVLVGSNLAWCHPVLYQRIAAAKQKNPQMRVVLVDPRRTMTADIADLHLAIRADGDVALFSGLLASIADQDAVDRTYVGNHTNGFETALEAARSLSLSDISASTGLSVDELTIFYGLFARTEKVVTVYSQGVNQSSSGTDKVNAIINCHLATGRIGKPGMGPFSVTGQPNAMGGREVGGFANVLAAHMEIENPKDRDRVRRFWQAPRMAERPGRKAVDMFRAVSEGRIKAIWIMATNPVDSLPDSALVEAGLKSCPFVVVSDVEATTDTLRHAHVALPAAGWGEKDGTLTNSERRISRQRAFLPLPGEARPDWQIICQVARRMGFTEAFSYRFPAEIFAEHAALSAFENDGTRAFDIGAVAEIKREEFERLAPFQWPYRNGEPRETRFFADGGFFTPNGKARFIAPVLPASTETAELVLNTGRVRDHWHTMTRTGKSARLSQHLAEPFVEINPEDAARFRIADADLVRISSAGRSIIVRALISSRQSRGTVFVPIHWNDQFAAQARVSLLVPGATDPHSGQPASKSARVRIARFPAAFYGFAVLRERSKNLLADYWALARCAGGWRLELAFAAERDWADFAERLIGRAADVLAYHDESAGLRRFAFFDEERLVGALFLGSKPVAVSRNWAVEQLNATFPNPAARYRVIAGRPARGLADRGALICSCFGVGANQIAAAVQAGCASLEAVGERLQAGTNCGSCRAEIKGLIETHRLRAAE